MSADQIVRFLAEWKEIVGAVIGGLFSLWVALLVAADSRNRENRAAATLLIATFTNIAARYNVLVSLAKTRGIPPEDEHMWLSEKLAQSCPRLSSLAEAAIARLMPFDEVLAVHLEMFRTFHGELETHVERVAQDYRDYHEHGKVLRSNNAMDGDTRNAAGAFNRLAMHASCASHLLSMLVLSRFSVWNRVRMRVRPTEQERDCRTRIGA